jgi:hypothetical protein
MPSRPATGVLFFLSINFGLVFLFSILYFLTGKYSGTKEEKKKHYQDYLWYSLLTQTTVGYRSDTFSEMSDGVKTVNMLQLASIFVVVALFWYLRVEYVNQSL